MAPDFNTLRWTPWQPGTASCSPTCSGRTGPTSYPPHDRSCGGNSSACRDIGLKALVGTELEFIVFRDTYEQAWDKGYKNLIPANQYNVDYSLLGTARIEPLLRRIRVEMEGAGLYVESAKGECNPGQHEIAFRYAEALATCDNHVIYKEGAKEIAAQEGMALTFMAKYNEREGNSCHIHISVGAALDGDRNGDGRDDDGHALSPLGASFIAGQLGAPSRADTAVRAQHQLIQAVCPWVFRPDRGGVGTRQPHLRDPARRPRARAADGEPGSRWRHQPVPRDSRHSSPPESTASNADWSSSRRSKGNAYTLRPATGSAHDAEARSTFGRSRRSRETPSATTSSTTTPTWPASSWPPSTQR